MLGWSQDQLAAAAKVAKATLANFELNKSVPYPRTLEDIKAALQSAGVVFLDDEQMVFGGPGVRLKHPGNAIASADELDDDDQE
jgi:transcriptional regulator with XRE-family HTH domain